MKQKEDKVIILKRINYGENDRIITVIGEKSGKQTIIAKGVRSPKSKLAGSIELFSISQIQFVEGRGDLGTLVGARLLKHFNKLADDIEDMQMAADGIKDIEKISHDGSGGEYFVTLRSLLESLDSKLYDKRVVWVWFCLQVLQIYGARPSFSTEANETSKEERRFNFDFDNQMFKASEGGKYSVDDFKLMRLLANQARPVVLQNELGSEDSLQSFATILLKTNLTEL